MNTNTCPICLECVMPGDSMFNTQCCKQDIHSSCMCAHFMKQHNCPLCRATLINTEDEEDDEEDGEDDEDDEEDDDDESTIHIPHDSESFKDANVTISQLSNKLQSLGYTFEDLLVMHFGGSMHPKDLQNKRFGMKLDEEDTDFPYVFFDEPTSDEIPYPEVGYKHRDNISKNIIERMATDMTDILSSKIPVDYTVKGVTYAMALMQTL